MLMSAEFQHGITGAGKHKLAYQLTKLNNKSVPQCEKHKIAGQGLLCVFCKCSSELALCEPQPTSLSRSVVFRKTMVEKKNSFRKSCSFIL